MRGDERYSLRIDSALTEWLDTLQAIKGVGQRGGPLGRLRELVCDAERIGDAETRRCAYMSDARRIRSLFEAGALIAETLDVDQDDYAFRAEVTVIAKWGFPWRASHPSFARLSFSARYSVLA